jgi:hypothetical protein
LLNFFVPAIAQRRASVLIFWWTAIEGAWLLWKSLVLHSFQISKEVSKVSDAKTWFGDAPLVINFEPIILNSWFWPLLEIYIDHEDQPNLCSSP